MTLAELKKGLLSHMMTIFPKDRYKYYSMDVIEGYDRPCFFTQLKPVDTAPHNYNSRNNVLTFDINYFSEEVDELEMLTVVDQLRDLFGLAVKIGDRAVKVDNFEWDFVGTDRNILEVSIDVQWSDKIEHAETDDIVESVETNTRMEE